MGPSFTSILANGAPIAPAFPTYLPLTLSVNVVLNWPTELAPAGVPAVSDIIDVTATAGGLAFQFSDARQVSPGYSALINNVGVNTFSVKDSIGNVLASIASGQVWQVYLTDNSTVQGAWRVFQFGAGVSSANAAALAGAGLKAITTTLNEKISIQQKSANYAVVAADRATCIEWAGGSGGTITFDPVALGADFFCYLKNAGTGAVTVAPSSGTIDGAANLSFNLENSAAIVSDGANLITLGFGQRVNSVFDFVQISLAADSGNVVLSGANLNRISYRFTGALAGNTTVVVPSTIQQYWVDNETTGPFSLTFGTGFGTTVTVTQGNRAILYCDGANVILAQTAGSITFTNGSAASPSITFTNDATTGVYLASVGTLAFSSGGVQRGLVDATGHWVLNIPDTSGVGTNTLQVTGPLPSGTALLLTQQLQNSVSPAFIVKSPAGISLMSISGNGTVGTDDLSLFQSNTHDATILNRATAALNLGTKGLNRLIIPSAGGINIQPPDSGLSLFMSGTGAGNSVIGINAAATTGASAPVLTANKPGAGTAILGWVPINIGGVKGWFPVWSDV